MLGIAPAHILAHKRITLLPEERQVLRYLYRPLSRRKKRHHNTHLAVHHLGRFKKPEALLEPDLDSRLVAFVMDEHVTAARNFKALRSESVQLAPVVPRIKKDKINHREKIDLLEILPLRDVPDESFKIAQNDLVGLFRPCRIAFADVTRNKIDTIFELKRFLGPARHVLDALESDSVNDRANRLVASRFP